MNRMDPPPKLPDRVKEVFRQQPQFLRFSKAYRAYVALYCAGELKLPPYVEVRVVPLFRAGGSAVDRSRTDTQSISHRSLNDLPTISHR